MLNKLALTLLLSISIAGLSLADVVVVENSGGTWSGQVLMTGNYSAVCMNLYENQYMAVGADGAAGIYKGTNNWPTMPPSSTTAYNAVTWNSKAYDEFIASKPAGGVDAVGWTSSEDTGLTGSYKNLCKNETVSAPNQYFGATTSGAVDLIYKDGGSWGSFEVAAANGYTAVASNNCEDQVYALNSNGLDIVWYNGSQGWRADNITTGMFTALVGDDQLTDRAYFAGPNGLMMSQWYTGGAGHVATQINSNVYTALASIGGATEGVFAARADGGIDRIYYDEGTESFVTETILATGYFSALAGDYSDPDAFMAIQVPEPTTITLLVLGGLGVAFRRRK